MQAITALLFLALAYISEAGLLRAPRTESPNAQTFSEFQIITSSTPSPTDLPQTFIIPEPSFPTATAQTTPGPLSYGFVGVIESASTSDPEPTAAPALNTDDVIVQGGSKFVQTTFWACETFAKETHCGWHEPILDVSSAAVASHPRSVLVRAGVVAACVVGVLLYGF
ncbi:hypothetical protein FHL15_005764 [Xylaria flabelliformis]|uniref:Uncharacterized protein n=1 Tax=Xylaria flabelliformis TaxID=2512241 RepID=A0A553HZW4_9PEZI|nr:hypothetical protein FHL15_005764 [Xylaria flabelliformis]